MPDLPKQHLPAAAAVSPALNAQSGVTLVDLLMALIALGILLTGLGQVLHGVLQAKDISRAHQQAAGQGRYALTRIQQFVEVSDTLQSPSDATPVETLSVSERLLDTVDNLTLAAGADGHRDADWDADGLINEGGGDAPEYVTFALDKSDAANWKLTEQLPDYSTTNASDLLAPRTLCEHVTGFTAARLSPAVVEIELTLAAGTESVTIKTRARAPLLAGP